MARRGVLEVDRKHTAIGREGAIVHSETTALDKMVERFGCFKYLSRARDDEGLGRVP